jgi:type IV secretory pathway VirB4 component
MAINAQATQDFVPIKEVRDGVVILKDGGLRAILLASSINLSLKSAEEQQAVLLQFQTFLNSLDFSTQISVQSRRLDIRPYLGLLENRMKEQLEPLLKIQTREYIEFIRSFTDQVNIMTKSFFITVPYTQPALGSEGALEGLKNMLPGQGKPKDDKKTEAQIDFEEKRSQLDQRIGVIQQGLSRIGVRTVTLGTEEIIELFYKIFNPGEVTQSIKLNQ